jgi:hypothetical protein
MVQLDLEQPDQRRDPIDQGDGGIDVRIVGGQAAVEIIAADRNGALQLAATSEHMPLRLIRLADHIGEIGQGLDLPGCDLAAATAAQADATAVRPRESGRQRGLQERLAGSDIEARAVAEGDAMLRE